MHADWSGNGSESMADPERNTEESVESVMFVS
jgi:hypothetical protein